jgi:hypothetical protein
MLVPFLYIEINVLFLKVPLFFVLPSYVKQLVIFLNH